jgi:hypothetical protein
MNRFRGGITGWLSVLAGVVCIDVWLIRHKRPTMSRTLGHFLSDPLVGPVLAGAWAGLTYHLLIEERLVRGA